MTVAENVKIGTVCKCGRWFRTYVGWKRHSRTCDESGHVPATIDGQTPR